MGEQVHQQQAPARTTQGQAAGQAPAPKASAGSEPLPAPRDLVDPKGPASFEGLSAEALVGFMAKPLEEANNALNRALGRAVKALRETRPPAKEDGVVAAIAKVVEILTGFALSAISHAAMGLIENQLGEGGGGATVDALRDTAKELSKKGGPAFASLFADNAAETAAAAKDDTVAASPTAETLLDEFEARQENALRKALLHGLLQVEKLRARLSRVDPAGVRKLTEDLSGLVTENAFGGSFEAKVVFEWLNLCTRLSLGHAAEDQGPTFAGANSVGGLHPTSENYKPWRYGNANGLLKIYVEVPDEIYGIAGLTLDSVNLNAGPGAVRALQSVGLPLSRVPIYRQIWFKNSSYGVLSPEPAFVLTPAGTREIDLGHPVLAAIGSMRPVAFDEAHDSRSQSPPGPVPTAAEAFRAGQASAGATVVEKWLTLFTTERVS